LRGLGLIDLFPAMGAQEEFAINSLARPLVPPPSEAESTQMAKEAILPLCSYWKDADDGLPAELRGWEAARLALLGRAPPR
jgi:hypothetical protein